MARFQRPAVWLILVLAFLALDFRPQRDVFHSVGDVSLYRQYAQGLWADPPQLPQEYPPLTAAIFVLPQLIAPNHYLLAFATLAALVAWLVIVLVDRENGQGGWLFAYLALSSGATLFFRFDGFVALTTLGAFLLAKRRHWGWAQALLALGVALKLYPVLLMPVVALDAWLHAPRRWTAVWTSAVGGLLVILAVGGAWLVSPEQVRTMLHYHQARPLQTESVGATLALLLGPAGSVWSFGSANLDSPFGPILIRILTLANLALLALIYGGFWRRRLDLAAAFAFVLLCSITTSKVFSTQYLIWVLPFVVLAGERRWLWLAISVATFAVYPLAFHIFEPHIGEATLPWQFALAVGVRNLLWLLACGIGWWDYAKRKRSTAPQQHPVSAIGIG